MQGAPFGLGALTLGAPRVFDAHVFPILSMLLVHPYLLAGFHSPTHTGMAPRSPTSGLPRGCSWAPHTHSKLQVFQGLPVHPEIEPASTLHLNSLSTQAGQPQGL